jgi:hypothetical protein
MIRPRTAVLAAVLVAASPGVAQAGWGPTAPVAPIPFADRLTGEPPRVAIDRNGDAIAAWVGTADDGSPILQVAVRPAGGRFGGPSQLSGSGQVTAPAVAMGPAGDAVVAWVENGAVRAATRRPGGPFSSAVGLTAPAGARAQLDGPELAVTGDGRAIAVWTGAGGAGSALQVSAYTPGAGWTAPITLSATGELASEPTVAVDDAGDAVVAWRRAIAGGKGVVRAAIGAISRPAATGATARAFFAAARDLSPAGQDATGPDVDLDETGAAAAVWTRVQGTGDTGLIQAATAAPGAGFGPPRTISSGKGANGPRVGVDAVGGTVAVWGVDRGSSPSVVQGALLAAGGAWTAPRDLSRPDRTDPLNEPGGARLAVAPNGEAIAVWARDDGEMVGFEAAVRPPGGGLGSQHAITGRGSDTDSTAPDVAIGASGEAVAVWEAGGGRNTALGAVFYEPPPRALITSLRAVPSRFPALIGPVLRFTLSRAGFVVVLVRPPGGGRALAALGLRGRRGANNVALGSRLATLPPGLYRLSADTGAGRPRSVGVAVTA